MPLETLFTGHGDRLHASLWTPDIDPNDASKVSEIVGVVIVVHGLGDHVGRFAELAEKLGRIGWATLAFDLPGHGNSPGKPGKIDSFDHVLADIAATRARAGRMFPGLPQVLLGHSMGGNFAVNYVLRSRDLDDTATERHLPLAGLALCAPMLLPPRPLPRPFIFAAWLTGYLVPWISFRRDVDASTLTSDDDQIQAIEHDPLMHSQISMYLATQLVSQGRWAIDNAGQIKVPTLVMYGKDDSLIDQAACDHIAIRIGQHATVVTWPNTRHALFHDHDREFVIQRLMKWLRRRQKT